MWKESYRIGIDCIDEQHIKLFKMTDEFLKAIDSKAKKEIFQNAIEFLKDYVVMHFREEEAYQASIGYKDIEIHKKEHQDFTNTVLDYEKQLISSDYHMGVLKNLAGTLTTWLIYHVADADQKIAGHKKSAAAIEGIPGINDFSSSVMDVLETMAGLNRLEMASQQINEPISDGDVFVKIGVTGDLAGSAIFAFTKKLAFQLILSMTFTEPVEIDEMVCSALAEITNISCGNAMSQLAQNGIICDIKPPVVSKSKLLLNGDYDCVMVQTQLGKLNVALQMK